MESRELLDIAAWNINEWNEYYNWINYLQKGTLMITVIYVQSWMKIDLGGIRTHNPAYLSNCLYVLYCFFSNRKKIHRRIKAV